jgi:hypothetical protein
MKRLLNVGEQSETGGEPEPSAKLANIFPGSRSQDKTKVNWTAMYAAIKLDVDVEIPDGYILRA